MTDKVIDGVGALDAETMRQFLTYGERQLWDMCKECDVLTSGTKLCHALELTACGASPVGALLPNGKLNRTVPELFAKDLRLEIEDLQKGPLNYKFLSDVCKERRLHNTGTKVGLAVCLALNKDRRHYYPCPAVDQYERRNRSSEGSRSEGSRGRADTGGEAASAGRTPQGTACRTPFAHLTVWSGT